MVLSSIWPCELILPMPEANVPAHRDAPDSGIGSTTWGDNHDIQNYGGAVLDK